MSYNPTLVSASLSDDELQKSINSLVNKFKDATDKMRGYMDSAVKDIKTQLQSLGNVNINLGTASDGGSTRRVKQEQAVTQAIKETTAAKKEQKVVFDEVAAAQDKALNVKSARDSFAVFFKETRNQARALEPMIKSWESLLQSRHAGDLEQIANKIKQVKHEMAELAKANATLGRTKPQGYMDEIGRNNRQVQALRQQLVALESEQQKLKATDPFKDNAYLDELYAKRARLLSLMNDETTTNRRLTAVTHELTEAQRKAGEEHTKMFYARTMKIPTDSYDMQIAKLERINALLERYRRGEVSFTPAQVSGMEKEVRNLQQMVSLTAQQSQNTGNLVQQQQTLKQVSKETVQAELQYASKAQERENARLMTLREIAVKAQGTSRAVIQSMAESDKALEGKAFVQNTNQLKTALEQMQQAYQRLSENARNSAFGEHLKQDIEIAKQALYVLQRYNKEVINSFATKKSDGNILSGQSSIESMRKSIKTLSDQYSKLTIEEIRAGKADGLIRKFQETSRAAQVLQRQLNTPLTFADANRTIPRTLDDMAYKMRQLQAFRQSIDLTKPTAASEIRQVDEALVKLQKDMDKYMSQSKDVLEKNNALARSWNYMKNRLAFYFTVGASTQFIKNLIDIRSQYEMNERALGILIGSAERGTQIFQELSNMALVSPYTLIELSSAAKQLTAYDIAARDVVDTTRRLADMASAVGVPMERLTYALGQIKAYGYLNSRDNRMFANAGIPLVKQLADYYTELEGKMVSTADVYDRIKKKAVGYNDVMQVINKMTDEGGRFFDFQAKMADTLKVRLANLTLAWNNMLNDIGKQRQGILTWTINSLKELFLHWKQFDDAVWSAAKVAGLIVILRTLSFAVNRTALYFGAAVDKMALAEVAGKRVAGVLKTIVSSLGSILRSPFTWITVAVLAMNDLRDAIWGANEAQIEFNKTLRDGAKSNYDDLSQFVDQYTKLRKQLEETRIVESNEGDVALKVLPKDINKDDASKAWDAIRERIELSTRNADEYIGRLMRIENVSERVRQGFTLLESLRDVNAALKEIDDNTIAIDRDTKVLFFNIQDGLITNIKDYTKSRQIVLDTYGDVEAAIKEGATSKIAREKVREMNTDFAVLRRDIDKTTESIVNFISGKGWASDTVKIEETFSQVLNKISLENNLSPSETMALRLASAEKEYQALYQAVKNQISAINNELKRAQDEDSKAALESQKKSYQQQLAFLKNNTAESRVYWSDFTKWMSEQHKSDVQKMFGNMTADQIKALDFSKGNYYEWVKDMVTRYEKDHNLAFGSVFNTLKNYVKSANQWSIRIPLIISTEESKSIYEQLTEADTQADTAYSKIERLKQELQRLEKLGGKLSQNEETAKRTIQVETEIAAAEKDAAAAAKEGGKSKKEESAARKENAAASKAERQAETELQKALKDELQLLDKVRNVYKSLTKDGVATTDALAIATSGYDKTLSHINTVLGKHGIAPLDITKFAGVQNPQAVMMMLQKQLDTLMKSSAVKPTEIKDLEVKLKDLRVDAASFNQKTITDSLNSELSKLDEEYQLSIALQADPELGDMFLNMFDIDPNELPKTIDEYAERVAAELNKALEKENISLPHLNLTDDDLAAFKNLVNSEKLTQAGYELIEKQALKIRGMRKQDSEDTYKKTKELEYKLADTNGKIAIEEEKLHTLEIRLANETRDEKKRLLELQIEDQKLAIDKLKEEVLQMLPTYRALFGSVAEHSAAMTRRLAKQYLDMLKSAKQGGDGRYTITDPRNGKQTTLSRKELGKQEDKANAELRKSQSSLNKIRESFTKGDDEVVDFWKGIEQIGAEMQKLSSVVKNVGSLAELLGADRATVEIIGDMAESISGVATLSQGVAQMASGDYLGGAASVIGGLTQAMSTWMDNGNNRINDEIKKSELAVKRLQVAYVDLEKAADAAYGSGVVGAKKAVAAAKELQLAEMERQLRLEESRDSKHRDDEKIADLRRQIKELRYEINETITEVTNALLGSDVGSFAENLVSSMIDAFKQGEDYMQVFEDKFDEMIDNMIMKSIVSRVVTQYLDVLWNNMDEKIKQRSQAEQEALKQAQANLAEIEGMSSREWAKQYGRDYLDTEAYIAASMFKTDSARYRASEQKIQDAYNAQLQAAKAAEKAAQDALTAAGVMQDSDITALVEELAAFKPELGEKIKELLGMYYRYGQENDKELSALQQGIQGITEDTAGALEAYMNGVSQQVYLHSDLLMQIRDAVVGYDLDVQVATISQMLLQLRSSYEVQQSIQSILSGWSSPNGLAVRVELNS